MRTILELSPSLFASSPQPDVVPANHVTAVTDDDYAVARRLGVDVTSEAFVRLGAKLISRAYDLSSLVVGGETVSRETWDISRRMRREIVEFFYAGGER